MRQALAYVVQESAFGGLAKAAQRELLSIAVGKQDAGSTTAIEIKPGTKLLREWSGKTHEVLVTDTGFVWEGTTYRSLWVVASTITGVQWSGHRFFGLVNTDG
jgi:hypothetical protein